VLLIDRLILRNFVRSYLICLISLLSLYIVVDLFTNLDDFAQDDGRLAAVLTRIGSYYLYRVSQIFDRLCEAIVLLAAMFTVAMMQRNNEFLPLLSAGVSTRRVLQPVFLGAAGFMTLGVANQELIIPQIADALMANKDDPVGDKKIEVQGTYDANGVHIEGIAATRREQSIDFFCCTIPDHIASGLIHLTAVKAYYVPPGGGPHTGGWRLENTIPPELENFEDSEVLDAIAPGRYFLYTTRADFDAATRNRTWYTFASTSRLYELLSRSDATRMSPLAVQFHMRLTRPVLGMLLVVLGLSLILRDQARNIFISAGLCLIMCAVFFGAIFLCKQLGDTDLVSPALSAWLPVMGFGPVAFVLYDAMHT
jgi:lipopolysaccharide export system permease protein